MIFKYSSSETPIKSENNRFEKVGILQFIWSQDAAQISSPRELSLEERKWLLNAELKVISLVQKVQNDSTLPTTLVNVSYLVV